LGFTTPIETTAELCPVVIAGMGDPITPETAQPGKQLKTFGGRVRFRTGGLLRQVRADGTVQINKAASVWVTTPPDAPLDFGTEYRATGRVWVQPYERDGRVLYSITVEG